MKKAKVENRKGNKEIVQSLRFAGVPVRSGIKAGRVGRRPGRPGRVGRRLG